MKRGLQIVLGLLSLIPLLVAFGGLTGGAAGIEGERHTVPLRIIIGAIFLGGLARVYSLMTIGHPGDQFYNGMIIELVLIIIIPWQAVVAKRAAA